MKKIIGVALIGLILAACGDRDENYFFENQDKAKEHLKSCEEKLMNALENGDDKKFNEINNDAECLAADSALKKQRDLDWQKEQEERELKERLAEEKRLQDVKDSKAAILADHQDKTWEKRLSEYLKQDCDAVWGINPTPECTAWIEFYNEAVLEGKTQLATFDFADLKTKAKEYCNLDQRRGSSCAVWQEALAEKGAEALKNDDLYTIVSRKQEFCSDDISNLSVCHDSWSGAWKVKNDELVNSLTHNDEEFIEVYNQCVDQVLEIESRDIRYFEKAALANEVKGAAPCEQAAKAYRNRGMGYAKFQVKIAE